MINEKRQYSAYGNGYAKRIDIESDEERNNG